MNLSDDNRMIRELVARIDEVRRLALVDAAHAPTFTADPGFAPVDPKLDTPGFWASLITALLGILKGR